VCVSVSMCVVCFGFCGECVSECQCVFVACFWSHGDF